MTQNTQNKPSNVFDWLDAIRRRPSMYLVRDHLYELESMIRGYDTALGLHHIDEEGPDIVSHFARWLYLRNKWGASQGWARAIYNHLPENTVPLDLFFELIDEFRTFKPIVLAHAVPKGKYIQPNGMVNKGELPKQIFMVQYTPEPIFFLKLAFASTSDIWNDQSLFASQHHIINFARTNFLVEPDEWVWL